MAHRFYDTTRWRSIRDRVIATQPLCLHCEAKGLTVIATQVDHIIPIVDGGNPTSMDNLQPLCATCHSRKTCKENEPEKTIDTTLGYTDTTVHEQVITKHGKGKKKAKSVDDGLDYNNMGNQ